VEDAARVIVTGFGPSLARVHHPVQHRPAGRLQFASILPRWGMRQVASLAPQNSTVGATRLSAAALRQYSALR
jgi:hypothetical protein